MGKNIELSGSLFPFDFDPRRMLDDRMKIAKFDKIMTEKGKEAYDKAVNRFGELSDEQKQLIIVQIQLLEDLHLIDEYGGNLYPNDYAQAYTLLAFWVKEFKPGIRPLLRQIDETPSGDYVKVSPDILHQFTTPPEDVNNSEIKKTLLDDSDDSNKAKRVVINAQFGNQTGLQGGSAAFERITLALAMQLSKASSFFKTEKTLEGMPISELQKYGIAERLPEAIRDEQSILPYYTDTTEDGKIIKIAPSIVPIIYENLARDMYGHKKGDDISGFEKKSVRNMITELHSNGGYYKPLKGGGYILIPYLLRFELLNDKRKPYGCVLILSPDFRNDLGLFASIGSDCLQKLKGNQKSITFNLFFYLAHSRPNNGGDLLRNKDELIHRLTARNDTYKANPGRLEKDFIDAIRICENTGIITNYSIYKNKRGIEMIKFTFPIHSGGYKMLEKGV